MNNRLCEMFGIQVPIFAFSHCPDVVVEVSKAGGLGVVGMARMSAERVQEQLRWINVHIGNKPYGIDILNPASCEALGDRKFDPERLFPAAHRDFVKTMLDEAGIPPLPPADAEQIVHDMVDQFTFTPAESARMRKASGWRPWPVRPSMRCATRPWARRCGRPWPWARSAECRRRHGR